MVLVPFHAVVGRLDRTEPLLPEDTSEAEGDEDFAILVRQGMAEVKASCSSDGTPRLLRVELAAWQTIDLPRIWDDPDRADEDPEEGLDHLSRGPRG